MPALWLRSSVCTIGPIVASERKTSTAFTTNRPLVFFYRTVPLSDRVPDSGMYLTGKDAG